MARSQFKITGLDHNIRVGELHTLTLFVVAKVQSIEFELCLEFVINRKKKGITIESISITNGDYGLLARAFLLKDVNELYKGLQQLQFKIDRYNAIQEERLSVSWEQFAGRFISWARSELLEKIKSVVRPMDDLLE